MQAYCTLRALQNAWPQARVELIDYASWRPVMRPYLSSVSVRSLRSDFRRMAKYRRFFRNELTFSTRRLISSRVPDALRFIRDQHYDAIYVGSDTVLELRDAEQDGLTAFWLDPSIRGGKTLLAASSHSVTYEALSDSQRRRMRATVDDFTLLGARDEATRRLLAHFTNGGDDRLRLVPDPTFTYEIDYSHVERYLGRRGIVFDRPVIGLHLLRNSTWATALADRFRRAGYLVASLRPAPYADLVLTDMSPFEQMGIYRYFSCLITHRFHDTIFCFKNGTPVIVFPEHATDVTRHGESRIHTLLNSFGIRMPTAIGDGQSMLAEPLFDIHRDVIAEFGASRERIAAVLRRNRAEYDTFVTESVRRCA